MPKMRRSSSMVSGTARKVYCATKMGCSIVKCIVLLQRNGLSENRAIKNGENMLAAKKYVAVCLGLHRMGHDKVTSMKQNTDKRYINAPTHLRQSVYLRETTNYQIWK